MEGLKREIVSEQLKKNLKFLERAKPSGKEKKIVVSKIQSVEHLNIFVKWIQDWVKCSYDIRAIFLPDNKIKKNNNEREKHFLVLEKEGTQKEKEISASLSRAEPGGKYQLHKKSCIWKALEWAG